MAQWNVGRRQGACASCEHPFEDGERHASSVRFEGEELVRADACEACWAAREAEREAAGDLFWWFTRHQESKRHTLRLDLEALEGLFGALAGHESVGARELRYLLCLLLMRKRRLKLERVERGGDGEALIVRRPRRKDTLRVHVFDFDAAKIEVQRTRLQGIFDGVDSEDGLDLDRVLAAQEEVRAGAGAEGEAEESPEDGEGEDDVGEEEPARGEASGRA